MKVISMRGEPIDMSRYLAQNEGLVAVGNAQMNARGDIIGPGGKIIKPREQIAAEYHKANPKAVRQVALRDLTDEVLAAAPAPSEKEEVVYMSPEDAVKKLQQDAAEAAKKPAPTKRKIEDNED